jgi:hypothetical protein
LVITTTTFYPDAQCVRAQCAIKMAMNAVAFGIPVIVIDGGSPVTFREAIQDFGAILLDEVPHAKGVMGPGRRQASRQGFEATDGLISGYVEAEKYDMPRLIETCSLPVLNGEADLCAPRRRSHESYPTAQQLAEPLGNLHFRQVTGLDLDMWFGPRFFNVAAGKFFLEYHDEYGGAWDPTHVPVIRAAAAGLRIVSPIVDYVHPREQTEEEENSPVYTYKRAAQLANLMKAAEVEAQRLGLPASVR